MKHLSGNLTAGFSRRLAGIFAVLIMLGGLAACYPDPALPRANVRVYELVETDTAVIEVPVPNALVRFNPPAGASQEDVVKHSLFPKLTDVRGEVNYELPVEAMIEVLVEQELDGKKRSATGTLLFYFDSVYHEKIALKAWPTTPI